MPRSRKKIVDDFLAKVERNLSVVQSKRIEQWTRNKKALKRFLALLIPADSLEFFANLNAPLFAVAKSRRNQRRKHAKIR